MRTLLIYIMLVFTFSLCLGKDKTKPPHIILIYVDDMGIGDASYTNGAVTTTPNIDKLAQNGKIFTQYYTNAPVCSPSRVAITTGMYPMRWNINTFLSSKKHNRLCDQSDYLDASAPSMAKILKSAGYQTAHIGKWHMGGGRDVHSAPSITAYGFDEVCSTYESPNPDPLLTSKNWIWAPTDSIRRWERTAYFVDKTLDFLDRNSNQACFVNLWPDDVHSPWVPTEQVERAGKKEFFKLQNLQPVLDEFDTQIGRLIQGLKERGLYENTLIIFTSDNGPAPSFDRLRTNQKRGVKNSLYEGGINMPFFVHWPAKIKSGQVDSTSIIAAFDILPSLLNLTDSDLPKHTHLDGEDISKSLFGNQTYKRKKEIMWDYGRTPKHNFPKNGDASLQLALREGKWKFFTVPDGSKVELYDLSKDPNEKVDISEQYPRLVKKFKAKTIRWYQETDKSEVKEYLVAQ
ncbi:sulfatase-like hydrolase/transferase [Sediminitomix flava]|uniref:Arylsulfatase A-like enzyme n=1 Tax=Sediminitomix flava TaxID=379075 RepID=A0A315Z6U4_SEDFL|nr:sulfatase-like hydrolase/transferase [Sediminitomix flava]PWJ37997.1 arylsulfatase A-like enzyme [Sediminitomix flava]